MEELKTELYKLLKNHSPELAIPEILTLCELRNCSDIFLSLLEENISLILDSEESIVHLIKAYARAENWHKISNFVKSRRKLLNNHIILTFYIKAIIKTNNKKSATKEIQKTLNKTNNIELILNITQPYKYNDQICKKILVASSSGAPHKLLESIKNLNLNKPQNAWLFYLMSIIETDNANFSLAQEYALTAIQLLPNEETFWANLANFLLVQGDYQLAYSAALDAITLNILDSTALEAYLRAASKVNAYSSAVRRINNLLEKVQPTATLYTIIGNYYLAQEQTDKATSYFEKAIDLEPEYSIPLQWLTLIHSSNKSYIKANKYAKRALNANPNLYENINFISAAFVTSQYCLDWEFLESIEPKLNKLITKSEAIKNPSLAFSYMAYSDDFNIHLDVANKTTKYNIPKQSIQLCKPLFIPSNKKVFNIGFISADIGNHVVSHLWHSRFDALQKNGFNIFIYSSLEDDGSKIRSEIQNNFNFYDIRNISDKLAAELIRSHDIDVLYDLTSYTSELKSGILAFRPAPIQTLATGFPSIVPNNGIYDVQFNGNLDEDYFNTVAINERIITIKGSGLHLNSIHHEILEPRPFSKDKFILGSFNEAYKITRETLNTWITIMEQNPNTILWIYVKDHENRKTLIQRIEANGIAEDRVVFADRVSRDEHIQRILHCDLILDTFPYGNHSSAALSLACGTPIIAFRGNSIVSRIASNYNIKCGLEHLNASSFEEYINIANRFIQDNTFRSMSLEKLDKSRSNDQIFNSTSVGNNLIKVITFLIHYCQTNNDLPHRYLLDFRHSIPSDAS